MSDIICHYGVIGMKWGVRRTPAQLGHKPSQKVRSANLDKWGESPETNVMYITGRSGSGKSTLAEKMADDKTDLIYLDTYFELSDDTPFDGEPRSDSFDKFLKNRGVKSPGNFVRGSAEYEDSLTKFEKALDDFGKYQWTKGRKVLAEGIQISDSSLWENKSFYKDKPVIILQTSNIKSSWRAMARDIGRFNLPYLINRITTGNLIGKDMAALANAVETSNGANWVDQYLGRELSD